MLGLTTEAGQQILRPYSIASPTWSDALMFYSINIKDGPLTSRLSKIKPYDGVILKRKSTGTLILDALKPGKRLFLFSTGTGFAPFASIIREPETYQKFDKIVLTHTCREIPDLAFSQMVLSQRENDGLLSKKDITSLKYYPTVTRDKPTKDIKLGRITDLILIEEFFKDLNIENLISDSDRVMLCGSQNFNRQMKGILIERGFLEGSINDPGDFVLEKAFVER
jgi:ferredoxin--NADP+ reductase